jgi:hypothetical protein
MKRFVVAVAACVCLSAAQAQEATAPAPSRDAFASQGVSGSAVVLRALDKITGRTRDIVAPVGKAVSFGTLEILARACERAPETEAPETKAFLEILDAPVRRQAGQSQEKAKVFSGWMFASSPGLNPLEHAVYDVWPIACRT